MAATTEYAGGPLGIDISPPLLSFSHYAPPQPTTIAITPADVSALTINTPLHIEHALPRLRPAVSKRRALLKRAIEIVPAAIALSVISSLVWGPIVAPVPFAICILTFQAYWLWRAHMTGIHAFKGFRLLRRYAKVDWRQRYDEEGAAGAAVLRWEDVRHIIIIPNYTESVEKLRMCLDSLANCETPSQIVAVLAMEEREGDAGREKASLLVGEYEGRIGEIFATFHPWGIAGEVAGKSSNENWAARRAKERLVDLEGGDIDLFTITSCDVDTVFDRKYFSCLTYNFATDRSRYRRFWQGPIFYYNNIWNVPAPARLPHALAGLNHLGRLARGFLRMNFPQSTYSLSLRMAHEVDYWDVDVIPEDWHMFLKCFYHLHGEVDVETMYTPVYMDGIRSKSYLRTFISYFQQTRRHAWGCSDIPYAVQLTIDHPDIPLVLRLRRLWALCESHILWSTQWFLVTLGRVIPFLMVSFGFATLPDWFPIMSKWLLAPCAGALIMLITLDTLLRPKRPKDFHWWLFPFQYGQWFLMAVISFFSSALPALDAQLRLALGKRMEYKVTEKA